MCKMFVKSKSTYTVRLGIYPGAGVAQSVQWLGARSGLTGDGIPPGGRHLFLFHDVHTVCVAHPASCPIGAEVYSRGVKLTAQSSVEVKNGWSCTPSPSVRLRGVHRDKFIPNKFHLVMHRSRKFSVCGIWKSKKCNNTKTSVGRNVCALSARTTFSWVIMNYLILLPSQHVLKYFIRRYGNSPDHFPPSHYSFDTDIWNLLFVTSQISLLIWCGILQTYILITM
jgi:hypothetical protein